jgi:hypothetical protein
VAACRLAGKELRGQLLAVSVALVLALVTLVLALVTALGLHRPHGRLLCAERRGGSHRSPSWQGSKS